MAQVVRDWGNNRHLELEPGRLAVRVSKNYNRIGQRADYVTTDATQLYGQVRFANPPENACPPCVAWVEDGPHRTRIDTKTHVDLFFKGWEIDLAGEEWLGTSAEQKGLDHLQHYCRRGLADELNHDSLGREVSALQFLEETIHGARDDDFLLFIDGNPAIRVFPAPLVSFCGRISNVLLESHLVFTGLLGGLLLTNELGRHVLSLLPLGRLLGRHYCPTLCSAKTPPAICEPLPIVCFCGESYTLSMPPVKLFRNTRDAGGAVTVTSAWPLLPTSRPSPP